LSTEKINNSHKPVTRIWVSRARFDLQRIFRNTQAWEEKIWHTLIHKERKVSKSRYWELTALYPSERQKPGQWQYTWGCFPNLVSMRKKKNFRGIQCMMQELKKRVEGRFFPSVPDGSFCHQQGKNIFF